MTRVLGNRFDVDGFGNARPLSQVIVRGHSTCTIEVSALWDTGSSLTLLQQRYAKSLGYGDTNGWPSKSIVGINGQAIDIRIVIVPRITIRGEIEGQIDIENVEIGFAILDARHQMLLGQQGILSQLWFRHDSRGGGNGTFGFGKRP